MPCILHAHRVVKWLPHEHSYTYSKHIHTNKRGRIFAAAAAAALETLPAISETYRAAPKRRVHRCAADVLAAFCVLLSGFCFVFECAHRVHEPTLHSTLGSRLGGCSSYVFYKLLGIVACRKLEFNQYEHCPRKGASHTLYEYASIKVLLPFVLLIETNGTHSAFQQICISRTQSTQVVALVDAIRTAHWNVSRRTARRG